MTLGDLTDTELELLKCAQTGAVWHGSGRPISASAIRHLLTDRETSTSVDPRGVRVRSAAVVGTLDLELVTTDVALELRSCTFDQPLVLVDARIPRLVIAGSQIMVGDTSAVLANGLTVAGDLLLDHINVTTSSGEASINLRAARVSGQVSARAARIENTQGPAIAADHARIGGDLVLDDAFDIAGSSTSGAVRLLGAAIEGNISIQNGRIDNARGPGLQADRLTVGGVFALADGATFAGHGKEGAVRLVSARVEGQLVTAGVRISNDSGPAFAADGLVVDRDLLFRAETELLGAGSSGAVRMPGAHIAGQVAFSNVSIHNDSGPAVFAEGLRAGGDLLLQPGMNATGNSRSGAVRLTGSVVSGRLSVADLAIVNEQGAALELDGITSRAFWMDATAWSAGKRLVNVDGLTYDVLMSAGPTSSWIRLLGYQTTHYAAQPYQQLANALRSTGREQDARRVLIAQHDDRRRRGVGVDHHRWLYRSARRAGLWLQKAAIGYGYRTWPAFLATAILVLVTSGLGWSAGHTGTKAANAYVLYRPSHLTSANPQAPKACGVVQQLSFGFRVPLVSDPERADCTIDTTTRAGQFYDATFLAVTLLTWATATIAIAGYTGLVRRP